jgi:1-deoxy-D-xylulose-5-phosphate reductoisomerase
MTVRPRRIAVLGSTGSIGQQTLDVIRSLPDRFEVVGLAAGRYGDLFRAQLAEFRPRIAAVGRPLEAGEAQPSSGLLRGIQGLAEIATDPDVDLVVLATVGSVGLIPEYCLWIVSTAPSGSACEGRGSLWTGCRR